MNIEILRSSERGMMQNSQFKGYATFSNGQKDTDRPDGFGDVYVFNDDSLDPKNFLGMHPHANVEIVTVMVSGTESHRDTLGIHEDYTAGDVQLISSGKGIYHEGGNVSDETTARHLQIWIAPKSLNSKPQATVRKHQHTPTGIWELLVSPNSENNSLQINQEAWISRGKFDPSQTTYQLKHKGNGVLLYVLEGEVEFGEQKASTGDTAFITKTGNVNLNITMNTTLLLVETVV